VMIAFGGSGPLHAARVARKLGVTKVICPNGSGVMSAFGLLSSPVSYEVVRARRLAFNTEGLGLLIEDLRKMMQDTTAVLTKAGIAEESVRHSFRLDMRYRGQGYEIEIQLADIAAVTLEDIQAQYDEVYARSFGLVFPDQQIEIVNWKVEATGPEPENGTLYRLSAQAAAAEALLGVRDAWSDDVQAMVPHAVYDRYALAAGTTLEGPALVEERESTCVVGPNDRVTVDNNLNLVITLGA